MWDEEEDNTMNDEMFEGSGSAWIMAHEFVLQNVDIINYVKHKTL